MPLILLPTHSLPARFQKCNVMIYAELGRLPLQAVRKYRIIIYWAKLFSTDNIILKQCLLTVALYWSKTLGMWSTRYFISNLVL